MAKKYKKGYDPYRKTAPIGKAAFLIPKKTDTDTYNEDLLKGVALYCSR